MQNKLIIHVLKVAINWANRCYSKNPEGWTKNDSKVLLLATSLLSEAYHLRYEEGKQRVLIVRPRHRKTETTVSL